MQTAKINEVHCYTLLISENEYVHYQTKNFLERIFDGSVKSLLVTLCQTGKLSNNDLDELKDYLKQAEILADKRMVPV